MTELHSVYDSIKETCARHMQTKESADPEIWENISRDLRKELAEAFSKDIITPEQVRRLECDEFPEIFQPCELSEPIIFNG